MRTSWPALLALFGARATRLLDCIRHRCGTTYDIGVLPLLDAGDTRVTAFATWERWAWQLLLNLKWRETKQFCTDGHLHMTRIEFCTLVPQSVAIIAGKPWQSCVRRCDSGG